MTTTNYQFTYLWMVLSILSTFTLSLEIVHYNIMYKPIYNTVEQIAFQKNAITLAGGVINYPDTNIVYSSLSGQFPYVEFASDQTGNGPLLTRYQSEDGDEKDKWDARIANAKRFKVYNEDMNKTPDQDMISNNLYYYGIVLYSEEEVQLPKTYYITSLYHTGGVKILANMLIEDSGFLNYMSNYLNRILFYQDLIRIWKKLALHMKMKICVGSPSNITVRVPDEKNTDYRPIFRHPEWAVGLGQRCENYIPNFSSKSVLTGKTESTETYQRTIETFTLGRIIYFIEIMMAHKTYESSKKLTVILDEMSARETMIFEDRGSTDKKYNNASLLEANGVYRKTIKEYREANPFQDGNTNKAVNAMSEKMFDLLEKMVGENSVMSGRPNWNDVEKEFTTLAQKVAPYFKDRRLLVI